MTLLRSCLKWGYKKIRSYEESRHAPISHEALIQMYNQGGRIPWSDGYTEAKWSFIKNTFADEEILKAFKNKVLPQGYGKGFDERVVEYAWIFSQIPSGPQAVLDAGSTFNFEIILKHPALQNKKLTSVTLYPESPNFNDRGVSYVYADLRDLPFRDGLFDTIVSQSTLEHIDMDNSIYETGGKAAVFRQDKSYEYKKAIAEYFRCLKPGGTLLITVPYGRFENHGFFQQFDAEMIEQLESVLKNDGQITRSFFRYTIQGWVACSQVDCNTAESFNPHTGVGKGDDMAAHSRAIYTLHFQRK